MLVFFVFMHKNAKTHKIASYNKLKMAESQEKSYFFCKKLKTDKK